jgi:hypothetical protein
MDEYAYQVDGGVAGVTHGVRIEPPLKPGEFVMYDTRTNPPRRIVGKMEFTPNHIHMTTGLTPAPDGHAPAPYYDAPTHNQDETGETRRGVLNDMVDDLRAGGVNPVPLANRLKQVVDAAAPLRDSDWNMDGKGPDGKDLPARKLTTKERRAVSGALRDALGKVLE